MLTVQVTVDPDGTLHWGEGIGYTGQLDRQSCSVTIREDFSDTVESSSGTMQTFDVHWVRSIAFQSSSLSGSLQVTLEDPSTHQMSCTSQYLTSGYTQ